ncbi:DUF3291 domain-containing protein [Streptomyces sp. NPDC001985]|uniref:DUF3291 domain-containing protein n=1 Tax=Streptomyces sp. NPDC001985 TaxID=3154406 RepID=UPI0033219E10
MPALPWVTPQPATPGTSAYVMASRLEVRSLADVPRFLLKSFSVWQQVRTAPGALGASLDAQPAKRVFYTLSAWVDRDALYAFVRTEPHKSVMTTIRPTMRSTTFTFWEVPVERLPIDWKDARRRIEEQARADARG